MRLNFGLIRFAPLFIALSATAQVGTFQEFPDVATAAKAGEFILLPSYKTLEMVSKPGGEKQNLSYYHQKMVTPGAKTSRIVYTTGTKEYDIPNSYIIAIPKGGKAKVGDIVLTWWQSGSGMQRAIVVNAKDPTKPIVRYLDLDYDNPAKSRDKSTTIGQMEEQLATDSFTLLKEGAPGSTYRCEDGAKPMWVRLISKAPNGQLFVVGKSGTAKVFAKTACKPIPIKPKVKVGTEVEVEFIGGFTKAKVERTDAKIGRVFVKRFGNEVAVAFGSLMP